jgi:two-component system response regulator NreC
MGAWLDTSLGYMPSHLRLTPTPTPVADGVLVSLPIRVVVADDHPLLRRILRLLLDHERDFEVIAEAGELASAAHNVEQLRPTVLVLDLHMPDGSSIELVGRLRDRAPRTAIVVLTMEQDPGFARRALTAGALGFVVKDQADIELPAAVRAAAHGQEYVSPNVAGHLGDRHRLAVEDA